jgi:UDP-glucuronate 4-epimerase
MIASALAGSPLRLYGDGSAQRDLTFIDDITKMIGKLVMDLERRDKSYFDVVNIGGGAPKSMLELVSTVEELLGTKIVYSRAKQDLSDVLRTKADYQYLYSLVGDFPKTKLEDGIGHFISWAKGDKIRAQLKSWTESSFS